MIQACRSRALPSRSAAAMVSSVDWPLTCTTRARLRTSSKRSFGVMAARSSGPSGGSCYIRIHHLFRIDDPIEFRLRDEPQRQGGGLEREVVIHGVVSDLRCLVVADHRRE